jgi:glyoxylase-like metal-dependent hydrolase (beta-lactamase superfamily II)
MPQSILLLIALAIPWSPVTGQAIQVKGQGPGFYRFRVGTIEITALNDGVINYRTADLLPTLSAEDIRTKLFEAGLVDPVGMSYSAYLVNTGDRLVLIDTGTGGKLNDSPFFRGAGHLLANLRAAGYRPEQVQEIYITHLGPDHVGGLVQGTERVFPNATLRASAREVAYFRQTQSAEVEAKDWRLKFWRDLFDPYITAGKFLPFEQDTVLVPGVRSLATYGHTTGHTSYLVESTGESMLILGDLVLVSAIQFEQPSLVSSFDVDRPAGAATRERIMRMAAEGDWWIAGSHISFPGIGKVRAGMTGWRFLPVNYRLP